MAHLDWSEAEIAQEIAQSEGGTAYEARVTLGLTQANAASLAAELGVVFSGTGGELRMTLPKSWIVFWKKREGESRLLLAHPQKDEWVMTIALEPEMGARVITVLQSLTVGQSITLNELGSLGSVSNFEMVIRIGN